MAKLSNIDPELRNISDKRTQKETPRLSHLWKEKMAVRKSAVLAQGASGLRAPTNAYTVKWDNPDLPKGVDVTVRHFATMDEAVEYGRHIAKTVDLRREADDGLAIRTGYNPKPEPSSVVPVVIETQFGLRELTEQDVWPERYQPDAFAKNKKKITPDLDKVRGI
ncbi:MAG: hypothetical protein P8J32_05425 [bacterium]|nr:hypothetical protein [bacterium]